MKRNKLAIALLYFGAGIVLLAVSQTNIRPKLADFCLGACVPMFLGAIIALVMHFRNKSLQA